LSIVSLGFDMRYRRQAASAPVPNGERSGAPSAQRITYVIPNPSPVRAYIERRRSAAHP
jgi:hypothetical protein